MLETPSPAPIASPSPLRLFDELSALSSLSNPGAGAPAAAWLDCAVRLELAAKAAGLTTEQRAKLTTRAKVARANAAAAKRTQPLPAGWSPPAEARAEIPTLDRCPGCNQPAHASETDDEGYHPGCRPSNERVTTRIPRAEANWKAAVRLRPVAMPVARDIDFARAVTNRIPLFDGSEVR